MAYFILLQSELILYILEERGVHVKPVHPPSLLNLLMDEQMDHWLNTILVPINTKYMYVPCSC